MNENQYLTIDKAILTNDLVKRLRSYKIAIKSS